MELYYKTYQKIKIYLDKVHCALPLLEQLSDTSIHPQHQTFVKSRAAELTRIQALLKEFLLNRKEALPYVPTSRCRAVTSWYGGKKLWECPNSFSFNLSLLEADEKIFDEIDYMLSDSTVPQTLKIIFRKHRERFRDIQISHVNL